MEIKEKDSSLSFSVVIAQLQPLVYRIILKGHFTIPAYQTLQEKIQVLINSANKEQIYLLVDFSNFTSVSQEARRWSSENRVFSASSIVYIIYGIISVPRAIVRYVFQNSYGTKVYEVQNEHEALQIANELITKYKMDHMAAGPSVLTGVSKTKITVGKKTFDCIHDKQWEYKHPKDTYFYEIDLIDYDIFVSRPSGYIEYNNSLTANSLYEKVVSKMLGDEAAYYRIQDYTNVVSSSLRARRDFTSYILNNIKRIKLFVFFGLNVYMKSVVKFGKLFHPELSKIKVVNSLEEALSVVLEHKYGAKYFEGSDNEDLDRQGDITTNVEVEALREELKLLKEDQQIGLDKLFQGIGNIIWEGNEDDYSKLVKKDSAFYDIFGALQMLRTDVNELAEEKENTIRSLQSQLEKYAHDIRRVKQEFQNVLLQKDNFIQSLNHDLRTPLQSITATVELLKNSDDTKEHERLLKLLFQSSSLLNKKVTQIKDISDLSMDKKTLSSSIFNIQKIIQSHLELRYAVVRAKEVKIKFEHDENIPSYLTGDLEKIGQVIDHFLDNAIKYTNEGQITVRTILKEDLETQMVVRVEVEDSGIGINPDMQESLFDETTNIRTDIGRFYRGKGLGLFICKQLVELMGGNIGFRSEVGKGSCFYFVITLNRGTFSKELNLLNRPASFKRKSHSYIKNKKCLIVDGDEIARKITQLIFDKLEMEIRFANSLEKFMHLYTSGDYDIVFVDVQMSAFNSLDAIKEIRKLEQESETDKQIPIIGITVNPDNSHKEECLNSGMNDLIVKPFSIQIVKKLIGEYTEK